MENEKLGDLGNSSTDDNIEKKPVVPKVKKVLTDKQKETLAKGRELRDLKRKERIAEKQRQEEEQKREVEEKIVKKAIAIKKKQIRKQRIIEPTPSEESEDDDGRSPTSPKEIFPQGNSIPHKRYELPPPTRKKTPRPGALPAPAITPQPTPRQPKLVFL